MVLVGGDLFFKLFDLECLIVNYHLGGIIYGNVSLFSFAEMFRFRFIARAMQFNNYKLLIKGKCFVDGTDCRWGATFDRNV